MRETYIEKIINRLYGPLKVKLIDMKIRRMAGRSPLKVVVGASGCSQPGWIPTDMEQLNLLDIRSWKKYFKERSLDAIMAEHVWEHLTENEAELAAENCFKFLKHGGYLRVAVPDGYHPLPTYIDAVRPGGCDAGAEDHKILYTYVTLKALFESAGFETNLLEWFDEDGVFHEKKWSIESGLIRRSHRHDKRNRDGELKYTSIILDARKKLES